jgi:von Willebrand factor A domain-containing protein 5
MESKKK